MEVICLNTLPSTTLEQEHQHLMLNKKNYFMPLLLLLLHHQLPRSECFLATRHCAKGFICTAYVS